VENTAVLRWTHAPARAMTATINAPNVSLSAVESTSVSVTLVTKLATVVRPAKMYANVPPRRVRMVLPASRVRARMRRAKCSGSANA